MAYVLHRAAKPTAAPLAEARDGFAFGPVLFGALLGAGLGVILAMLLDEGLRFAVHSLDLSAPLAPWCAGALTGAVCGGLLSAWIGTEVGDTDLPKARDEYPLRRTPIR